MTGTNPEYQYHLKDHLGNVRSTFTTERFRRWYWYIGDRLLTAEQAKFFADCEREKSAILFAGPHQQHSDRLRGETEWINEREVWNRQVHQCDAWRHS